LSLQLAKAITIEIPEEFSELCAHDVMTPRTVLCAFIADVCSISFRQADTPGETYNCGGFEDGKQAKKYYDQVFGWRGGWYLENVPHLVGPGQKESTSSREDNNG